LGIAKNLYRHLTRLSYIPYDVAMKAKEIKKIQFGGYTKRDYREIRRKIKRIDKDEIAGGRLVFWNPHKVHKLGSTPRHRY